MDAYELQQTLLAEWRNLALISGADSVKKEYNKVPVCVKLGYKTYDVTGLVIEDGKIILETV
jgi:hypothetical protein